MVFIFDRPLLGILVLVGGIALLGLHGCTSPPTSILLHVEASSSVPPMDELSLDVYTAAGAVVTGKRMPSTGVPRLPADMVLYPGKTSGKVRIRILGLNAKAIVGEGAGDVELAEGEQIEMTVIIETGRLVDLDGDGVPDLVDNCPGIPNPKQGPCGGADGGADYGVDTGADGPGPDAADAAPPDLGPDMPQVSCTKHSDCDDSSVCTTETCVLNECKYIKKTCPPPSGTCKQVTCDPKTGCAAVDKKDGVTCTDSKYCTVKDVCAKGVCKGTPRDCTLSAPICNSATCDVSQDKCVYKTQPNGTVCDDKNSCTQGETCASSVCVAPKTKLETVTATNLAWGTDRALTMDSKGNLHLAYYNTAGKKLHHATNATGKWVVTTVEQATGSGEVGDHPAMAIDKQGTLHIVYTDFTKKLTRHASKASSGSWSLSTISAGKGHNSIAAGQGNKLHVSYCRSDSLWYATGTKGSWTTKKVDDPVKSSTVDAAGVSSSIAIDSKGKVHISHGWGKHVTAQYAFISDKLRHSTNASGSWVTVDVAPSMTSNHGGHSSIAVAKNDDIHISHWGSSSSTLLLSSKTSAGWATQTLKTGSVGGFTSLRLSPTGQKIHVAFRQSAYTALHYITNQTGSWVEASLDNTGKAGRHTSMVQAPSGRIHITHEDDTSHLVRHVTFSACP